MDKRFKGYQETELLWLNKTGNNLPIQFDQPNVKLADINENTFKKLRLGNLVEQFFFNELRQIKSIKVLTENLQIVSNKTTIGELDCILSQNDQTVHVEVVYKFYLYQKNSDENELENWVGPNLNDNLVKKLKKLTSRQFPLLYESATRETLKDLIQIEGIRQRTFFKAQLFVPYQTGVKFDKLNRKAIQGFYINHKEISRFQDANFYIPEKLDWLTDPFEHVSWIDFKEFENQIKYWISVNKSPMCWMKSNNELKKFFISWW